ncbi:MAG: hypothetical protein ACXACG_12195 [Candidatus Thorarchaeota archaeon]|jgi:hypothetical protein
MTENSRRSFEIIIERTKDGIGIKARGIQIDEEKSQFKEAYKLVQELWYLAEMLDFDIEQEFWHLIENGRTRHLWNLTNQLSEVVHDTVHRIALCLLRKYPDCLTQQDIAELSNIPRTTVRDNLRSDHYRKCETGFQLSESGIIWLRTEILPQYIIDSQ